jgi:hypothetical protein
MTAQPRRAAFKQSDATRAMVAAKKAGMGLAECRITTDGTITLVFGEGTKRKVFANEWDEVLS